MELDLFAEDPDFAPRPPKVEALDAPSPSGLEPDPVEAPSLLLGCCAWNHPSFDRHFYPAGLRKEDQLTYYSRFFNAVEVDSTFYHVATPAVVARWKAAVPSNFRFAVKAPRLVTHDHALSLESPEARAVWEASLSMAEEFGPQLCAYLIQLPPTSTNRHQRRLEQLLIGATARRLPVVVEFRHASWNTGEVRRLLHSTGVSRAWVDHYNDPTRGMGLADAEWLFDRPGTLRYMRLLGDMSTKYEPGTGRRIHQYGSLLFDRRDDLPTWVDRVKTELTAGSPVAFFINNHYEGFAPYTCRSIRKAINS